MEEEALKIRLPDSGDAPAAMEFVNSLVGEDVKVLHNKTNSLEEEERWLGEQLAAIAAGNEILYFAFAGEKLVGSAEIKRGRGKSAHVGTVGISVAKGWRGRGLGTELLEKILLAGRSELGLRIATLTVFANNLPAINLYRKAGFVEEGRLKGHIIHKGAPVNQLQMSKEL